MSRSRLAVSLALLMAVCLVPLGAAAASPSGTSATGFRIGENSTEGFIDLLMPLYATEGGLAFVNPVFSLAEGGENEINIGAGWRQLAFGDSMLLGGNVYFDSRLTEHDHRFNQVGIGAELLSRWIDARANYYLPEDQEELIGSRESETVDTAADASVTGTSSTWDDPYATDHTILQDRTTMVTLLETTTTTTTRRLFEQHESALEGFDAEVGVLLPLPAAFPQARFFGGYYSFDDPYGDRIEGPKGRVEIRIGSHLTLDAEFFDDDRLNDTRYFAGARLYAPFDLAALFTGSNPFAVNDSTAGSSLASRMNEMVMRDMRVQTGESPFEENLGARQVMVAAAQQTKMLFVTETFTLLDDVTFVDDDNQSGIEDGTAEHPFDVIQEGVDGSFGEQYVYVFGGTYSSATLLSGVTLWGEGTAVAGYGGKQFGGGTYPTINGASPAVTVAADTRVTGFHIVNLEDQGIYGDDLTGSVIIDNNIIDVATAFDNGWVNGVCLYANDATVTITGNVITSLGGYGNGIYLGNNGSLAATISGNTILSDGWDNWGILAENYGGSMELAVTGNTIDSLQSVGVWFENYSEVGNTDMAVPGEVGNTDMAVPGEVGNMDVTVSGNTITSAGHGIYGVGLTGTVTIDGNIIEITDTDDLSVSDGIQLVTNDAVVAITGNDIINPSGMGNGIFLDNNGVLQATIDGNTIFSDGWANHGIHGSNNGSSMTAEVTGNNVVSVEAYGVNLSNYGQSMDLTVSGNTIRTDSVGGLDGLVIHNDGGQASEVNALVSGNTVTVNRGWTAGIVLENDSGVMNATVTANTLNVSGDEGAGIELYNFGVMNVQLTANTLNLNFEHSKGVSTFNYGEADFTVTDNTINVDPNTSAFQSAWGFAFRNLFGNQVLTATGNQINGEAAMGMYLWNPDNPNPAGTFTVRASGPVLSALNNGMLVWYTPNVAAFTFVP